MNFERTSFPKRSEESESHEPHPDANKNLSYCIDLLKKIEVLDLSLGWQIYDYRYERKNNSDELIKVISDPKVIIFFWHEKNITMTGERNFNMPNDEFRKTFVDCLNFLMQRRLIKRFGIAIGTMKKSARYDDRYDDKYSDLYR